MVNRSKRIVAKYRQHCRKGSPSPRPLPQLGGEGTGVGEPFRQCCPYFETIVFSLDLSLYFGGQSLHRFVRREILRRA